MGIRWQYRTVGSDHWYTDQNWAAMIERALESNPYLSIEVRIHPDDRQTVEERAK